MKVSTVLCVFAILCVLESQAKAETEGWSVLSPAPGTFRGIGSVVIGNGNGPAGETRVFKFGKLVSNGRDPGNQDITIAGENEIEVTGMAMMPGMPGAWRTNPASHPDQLAAPGGGWTPSPPQPGMPGMRVADHCAGIIRTVPQAGNVNAYEYCVTRTANHTVTP